MPTIECKPTRERLINQIKNELASLAGTPILGIIQVEGDDASNVYVRNKKKLCHEVGIKSVTALLPATISQNELEEVVREMNADPHIHGLMVQLPLPDHLDAQQAIDLISTEKDVDGLTTGTQGLIMTGQFEKALLPCTPAGVLELLADLNIDLTGKNVAVVGRSQLFGLPMARLLTAKDATVTLCHSKTKHLEIHTRYADIVITAIGVPYFFTRGYFAEETTVIDVGMTLLNGKLCGDVLPDYQKPMTHFTPTPGGTGLITVPMLLKNTIKAYKLQGGE